LFYEQYRYINANDSPNQITVHHIYKLNIHLIFAIHVHKTLVIFFLSTHTMFIICASREHKKVHNTHIYYLLLYKGYKGQILLTIRGSEINNFKTIERVEFEFYS